MEGHLSNTYREKYSSLKSHRRHNARCTFPKPDANPVNNEVHRIIFLTMKTTFYYKL